MISLKEDSLIISSHGFTIYIMRYLLKSVTLRAEQKDAAMHSVYDFSLHTDCDSNSIPTIKVVTSNQKDVDAINAWLAMKAPEQTEA